MAKIHGADRRQTNMSLGRVAQTAIEELRQEGVPSSVESARRNAVKMSARSSIIPLSLVVCGVFSTNLPPEIGIDHGKFKKRPKEKIDLIAQEVAEMFSEQECFYVEELKVAPGFRYNKRAILAMPNHYINRENERDV